MRRFTSVCIDNVTKMEMILFCCSFNEACMFLETENADERFGEYKGMEACSLHVSKFRFEKATFYYDEERGLLLRPQHLEE